MQYKSLLGRLAELEAAVRAVCVQPQHCQQFLRAGRIVAVRDGEVRESVPFARVQVHTSVRTNSLYHSTGFTFASPIFPWDLLIHAPLPVTHRLTGDTASSCR